MTEARVADALEREHREIDAGLEEFRRGLTEGETRGGTLRAASRALRRHIFIEEELLFPPLRDAGLVGPVTVMLMEHAEIWSTLDELERLIDSGSDPQAIEQPLASLSQVLEEHNIKEERILYPQADATAGAEVTSKVLAQLADGELPPGWVCQRLANNG